MPIKTKKLPTKDPVFDWLHRVTTLENGALEAELDWHQSLVNSMTDEELYAYKLSQGMIKRPKDMTEDQWAKHLHQMRPKALKVMRDVARLKLESRNVQVIFEGKSNDAIMALMPYYVPKPESQKEINVRADMNVRASYAEPTPEQADLIRKIGDELAQREIESNRAKLMAALINSEVSEQSIIDDDDSGEDY